MKEGGGVTELKLSRTYKSGAVIRATGKNVSLTLDQVLGKGASGVVISAEGKEGTKAAVKCFRRSGAIRNKIRPWIPFFDSPTHLCDPSSIRSIERELGSWKAVESDFIVKLIGSKQYFFDYWIAMEDCMCTTSQILEQFKSVRYRTLLSIYAHVPILGALKEIHSRGFVHRDVKPENILVNHHGIPKLCDFGLMTKVSSEGVVKFDGHVGTPYYVAPEVIRGDNYDGRVDVFGLALVIIVTKTNCHVENLFYNEEFGRTQILYRYRTKESERGFSAGMAFGIKEEEDTKQRIKLWRDFMPLLTEMTSLNQEGRPTVEQVLEDEMIGDIMSSWDAWVRNEPVPDVFKFALASLILRVESFADPETVKVAKELAKVRLTLP